MKPEIAEKWIAALRSDKYTQARGQLKTRNGFCCLGVLCELYREETGNGNWDRHNNFSLPTFTADAFLPPAVKEWAGMASGFGLGARIQLGEIGNVVSLAELNDAFRYDFPKIAEVIEQNAERL